MPESGAAVSLVHAAPAEPRLRAVESELLPLGVTGRTLSTLEDAWLPLLGDFPWKDEQAEGLKLRGRILFGIGATLLSGYPEDAEAPGALWSLVDGARHCTDVHSRMFLLAEDRYDQPRICTRGLRAAPLRLRDPPERIAGGLLDRTGGPGSLRNGSRTLMTRGPAAHSLGLEAVE